MEHEKTLLWVVAIVAVVGIVAMVIAATQIGTTAVASGNNDNLAGNAKAYGGTCEPVCTTSAQCTGCAAGKNTCNTVGPTPGEWHCGA